MISLFLDSCDKKIIVAVLKDNHLIYEKIRDNDNHLSEIFLPMIKEALDELEYTLNDVGRIYIVNGPGSFTGIRVGVTTAKVIAWGLNKEIVTISELEVLASTYIDHKYCVPYIDARRDCVYAGMYDSSLNKVFEDVYISKEKLLNKIRRHSELDEYIFVSYDSLFENISKFKNSKLLLIDDYDSFKNVEIENWYSTAIDASNGIWVGEGVDEQMLIEFDNITNDIRKENFKNIAIVCEDGKPVVIKHIVLEASNE